MPRATRVNAGPAAPLHAGVVVVDDFLPAELAAAMRADIDGHFAEPFRHRADTHQVWNYWFVPGLYTYLRTSPEKVIRRDRVEAFAAALEAWSIATLGMGNVTWPYLSLYVDGCRQGLHNDATNGRFGYVYSLTRDRRRTEGGQTLVFREGDPFRGKLTEASAGPGFYDGIEPEFNRLVVFDDRLPHAVERVEGSMDPVEGRFVLHGHLSETGTIVAGVLPAAAVEPAVVEMLRGFAGRYAARIALYQGPLALRFVIGRGGAVETCDIVLDRVACADPGDIGWEPLRGELAEGFKTLKFAPAASETTVTQPIAFGPPLPGAG